MPGYETAIVRLTTDAGTIAGVGVLVGRNAVVTCAHVVNVALGEDHRKQQKPDPSAEVTVRFPLLEGAPVRMATVAAWVPPPSAGAGSGDVAGVILKEEAPADAFPAKFATEPGTPGEVLRVFGYPSVPPRRDGAWVDVDLKGNVGHGLIQVESRSDQTIKAQPGFSGSPVWSEHAGQVVGLLHAATFADEPERDAYLVPPATVAKAWEEQFDYLLVPSNPYRGLEPFTVEDAGLFFGRDAEIDTLHGRVTSQPVTVVVGPSGVGKSSLVQAGLIPRLRVGGGWAVALIRPGKDPWLRLAAGLLEAQLMQDTTHTPVVSAAPPMSQDAVEQALQRLRQEGLDPFARFLRSQDRSLLVVVDQFEEVVASGLPDAELLDVLLPQPEKASDAMRIVLTLRTDFLSSLLEIPGIGPRLGQRLFTLSPLSTDQVREAVERPATAKDVGFEPGLVDEIVTDTAAGSLPLLEFTLTRLWGTQRQRELTFAGYRKMGGVEGALDQFAEKQLAALDPEGRAVVERILLRLVHTPTDDPRLTTRQRVHKADLRPEEWQAIQHLSVVRLVVTGTDTEGPYAELAHEALITSWRRLSRLVTDNAKFLGWLAGIQRRTDDDPLPESRLDEARQWLELRADDIPAKVKAFVAASQAAAEARHAQQTQAQMAEAARRQALQVAESLRLASEAREAADVEPETAFLVAWEALLRDRNELSEAVFQETLDRLPAAVRILLDADDVRVTAVGFVDPGTIVIAQEYWAGGHLRVEVELRRLNGARLGRFPVAGEGNSVVAVPGGGGGLLIYRDGVLRRHDAVGALVDELALPGAGKGSSSRWRDLSFSDRGTCLVHDEGQGWLVSLGADMAVMRNFRFRWSREEPGAQRHLGAVFQAIIDRTGDYVVTRGEDGARIWDTAGFGVVVLEGLGGTASASIFADGTIMTGGMGGDGATWDRNGSRRSQFREAAGGLDLFIGAIGPSGEYVATTVNRSGVIDVRGFSGDSQAQLHGPAGRHAWSAAFSPDGQSLASGWDDRVIRVWEWRKGGEPVRLHGHNATVHRVAFHPKDSELLLSADQKGAVRLWHLEKTIVPSLLGHEEPVQLLTTTPSGLTISADNHRTKVWSPEGDGSDLGGRLSVLSYAPDGRRTMALTVTDRGSGLLWDIDVPSPRSYAELSSIPNLDSAEATISPDGQYLVLVQEDHASLWSAAGHFIAALVGDDPAGVDVGYRRVVGVGFRPDGTRLAVAAKNGAVWIWTVEGRLQSTFVVDTGSPDRTFDMACDPEGQLIATAVRNEVGLWDWEGRRAGRLNTTGYKVSRVAFSRGGERILTISDNPSGRPSALPELWTRDGHRLALMDWIDTSIDAVPVFDGEGRYVLLPGSGLFITDWNGKQLARLAGPHGTTLIHSAHSSSGNLVAALFNDGKVRIWSQPDRRRTKTLHIGNAGRIAFSADGQVLLAGTATGPITRHPLDVEALFAPAKERVARVLSRDELERFGIEASLLEAEWT